MQGSTQLIHGARGYQQVTKLSERPPARATSPGRSVLAVAASGCGHDLHVLAEDGFERLVSVHHGAEHEWLAGGRALSHPRRRARGHCPGSTPPATGLGPPGTGCTLPRPTLGTYLLGRWCRHSDAHARAREDRQDLVLENSSPVSHGSLRKDPGARREGGPASTAPP